MDPTKLSEYSRGVMAPLAASKHQHQILNKEMSNGLAGYMSQELLPDMGLKIKGAAQLSLGFVQRASVTSSTPKEFTSMGTSERMLWNTVKTVISQPYVVFSPE
jgi:hypothetical protein